MKYVLRTLTSFPAVFLFAVVFLSANFAFAQGFTAEDTGLQETGVQAGFQTELSCMENPQAGGCIPVFIGYFVDALLGIFGAIFLILIIWGGVQYMFAQGDTDKVQKAQQTIKNAILGMIIVAASYAIANFVLDALATSTGGGTAVVQ